MFSDTICDKAMTLYEDGQYEEAFAAIQQCNQAMRRSSLKSRGDDDIFKRSIYFKLIEGKILLKLKRIDEAEEIAVKTKSQIVGTGRTISYLRGELYRFLSEVSFNKGNMEDSYNLLQQAKDLFIDASVYSNAVNTIFDHERYPEFSKNVEKQLNLYREALDLNKKNKDKNDKLLVSARVGLRAGRLLRKKDPKRASSNFLQSYKDFEKLQMTKQAYEAKLEYAEVESNNKLDDSIKLVNETFQEAESVDLKNISLIKLAKFRLLNGDLEGCKSLVKMIQEKDLLEGKIYDVADNILSFIEKLILYANDNSLFELTNSIIRKSLELHDKIDDKEGKILNYFIEGLSNFSISLPDSRLQLIPHLAGKLDEIDKDFSRVSNVSVARFLGSPDQSADAIFNSYDPQVRSKPLETGENYYMLGIYKLTRNENEEAKMLFEKSKRIFDKHVKNSPFYQQVLENIESQLTKI